jgi:hypothetical protein
VELAAVAMTEVTKRKSRSAVLTAHHEMVWILLSGLENQDDYAHLLLSVCFTAASCSRARTAEVDATDVRKRSPIMVAVSATHAGEVFDSQSKTHMRSVACDG